MLMFLVDQFGHDESKEVDGMKAVRAREYIHCKPTPTSTVFFYVANIVRSIISCFFL